MSYCTRTSTPSQPGAAIQPSWGAISGSDGPFTIIDGSGRLQTVRVPVTSDEAAVLLESPCQPTLARVGWELADQTSQILIPIGKSAPVSIVRRAPPTVFPSLVSSHRRRAKPSLSLCRSSEERRGPESCFSFRSGEEPPCTVYDCRPWLAKMSQLGGVFVLVPCALGIARVGVVGPKGAKGIGEAQQPPAPAEAQHPDRAAGRERP